MSANEAAIEAELQAKGKTAPRLTPAGIDAVIADERYHMFPGTTLTVCVLVLRNGFTVLGESAAASPENFDAEVGRKIARENARQKIWMLEGYLLRERLFETERQMAPPGTLVEVDPRKPLPEGSAALLPHIHRMQLEEHELAEKVFRLNRFILRSSIYEGLPQDEKDRMVRQLQAMVAYQTVLGERLAAAKAGG